VTSRGQIAWNYAKTWLIIDAVAVIPYELLTPNQEVEAAQLAKVKTRASRTAIHPTRGMRGQAGWWLGAVRGRCVA